MEMSGERMIDASPAEVWAALNDPEILKASIPGCEEMTKTSPTQFEAVVVQKVGPVRARFTGEVELTDIVEGQSYRITGRGKGGAAGGATGGAAVALAPAEGGTLLKYEAEAKVTGKIAQLGSRLIAGFAKKMADDFFDRFKEQVEGGSAEGGSGGASGSGMGAGEAVMADAERIEAASRDVARNMGKAMDEAEEAISKETHGFEERLDEFSKEVDEETREFAGKAASVADRVTSAIGEAAEDVYEGASKAVHDVFEKDETGKSKFDRASDEVDERTRGAARDLAGPVDRVTHAIDEAAEEIGKAISESPPAKKSFWKRLFGG